MLDRIPTIQYAFVCVLLAVFLIGCTVQLDTSSSPGNSPEGRTAKPAFKGMELYSWRVDTGEWRYSILPGTNRLKSIAEVQEHPMTLTQLKTAISNLAQGESLFWLNRVDSSNGNQDIELTFPPSALIEELELHAAAHQVTLFTPPD